MQTKELAFYVVHAACGYVFYWLAIQSVPLGLIKPYLGHGSYVGMRQWAWNKFWPLIFALTAALIYRRDPQGQAAVAVLLTFFVLAHFTLLFLPERWWDDRWSQPEPKHLHLRMFERNRKGLRAWFSRRVR